MRLRHHGDINLPMPSEQLVTRSGRGGGNYIVIFGILLLTCLLLAFANGANDNFKGVATLFGSGTTNYRAALTLATVTTCLGSFTAILLAGLLLEAFGGKGFVSDALVGNAEYCAAVALGTGLTVLLAARIGMPVSTTHGLVGALVGAGFAAESAINFAQLGGTFFLPLLTSPILALAATALIYPILRFVRRSLGVTSETCLCANRGVVEVIAAEGSVVLQRAEHLKLRAGDVVTCRNRYQGHVFGLEVGTILDKLHYLSAGVASFARGLNDTPKIAALLLVVPQLGGKVSIALVGLMIAIGGVLNGRRVAETMSKKISGINHGQGLTSNLISGIIVIGASALGVPVSTTHVSCGSLFGIGTITGQARWMTVSTIIVAWVATLPVGAILGALSFWIIRWC